jgi:hypothetical protein
MIGKLFQCPRAGCRWLAVAAAWAASVGALAAQTVRAPAPPSGPPVPVALPAPPRGAPAALPVTAPASDAASTSADGGVVPVGCASCGGGLIGAPVPAAGGGGDGGCGGCDCYPGRYPCDCCCNCEGHLGRIFCGFYQCVCCPDPCYQGYWNALADNAFWFEGPRPVTQLKLGFEYDWHMPFPDKSEWYWARADANGAAKGPRPFAGAFGGTTVRNREFWITNEIAVGAVGVAITMPYRNTSPESNYADASGFGDLTINTKTLLLDCELLQVAFGFKVYTPTGNVTNGLGTGHVSLEPGLYTAVKLTENTYFQGSMHFWIPVGGDADFEGDVFHYHLALNHLLWHCGHGNDQWHCGHASDIKVVGTAELNGYCFLDGDTTDGFLITNGQTTGVARQISNIGNVVNFGLGARLIFCDKIDFGVAYGVALTDDSIGDKMLRAEFRWRF